MTIDHQILTVLKDKSWIAGGTLERELSDLLSVKPATISKRLRDMSSEQVQPDPKKRIEKTKDLLPRRAVSYRHRCEGNCWDVQDNVTKEIYHKFK